MAGDGTTSDAPWTAPPSDADQQWAPDSQPAGQWLADPWYRYEYRYQHTDGTWSDNVASGGVQGVDRPVDGSLPPTGVVPVVGGVAGGVPGRARRRRLVPLLLAACAVIVVVGAILVATNDSGGKKTVNLSPTAASPTTALGGGGSASGSGGSTSPSTGPDSSTTTVAGGNTATGSTTTSTTAATTTTTVAGTATTAATATTATTSAPAATTPTTAAPLQSGDFQLVSFSPTNRGAAFSGFATIRNTSGQGHGANVQITLYNGGNLVATLNGETPGVAPGQAVDINLTSSDRVQAWTSYVFTVTKEF